MTFQTSQNDNDNRYKNSSEELQNEICSIWQEWVDEFQTFEDMAPAGDTVENIQKIKVLLEEAELDLDTIYNVYPRLP